MWPPCGRCPLRSRCATPASCAVPGASAIARWRPGAAIEPVRPLAPPSPRQSAIPGSRQRCDATAARCSTSSWYWRPPPATAPRPPAWSSAGSRGCCAMPAACWAAARRRATPCRRPGSTSCAACRGWTTPRPSRAGRCASPRGAACAGSRTRTPPARSTKRPWPRRPTPLGKAPAPANRPPKLATLQRAIARLPPAQQATLALHHLEGLGVAQIALAMDVPPGTVKTRLMHARRKLRQLLEGAP